MLNCGWTAPFVSHSSWTVPGLHESARAECLKGCFFPQKKKEEEGQAGRMAEKEETAKYNSMPGGKGGETLWLS